MFLRSTRRKNDGKIHAYWNIVKNRRLAGGTAPREALEKFKTLQMVDMVLPTEGWREPTLSCYTQPEADHRMLLQHAAPATAIAATAAHELQVGRLVRRARGAVES